MAAPREKSAAATSSAAAADAAGAGGGGDRWGAAVGNLTELGANVAALQRLLAKKAVFVDEDIFSKASLAADQARTIKVILLCFALLVAGAPDSPPIPSPILDQRVQSLERELDAAISAAARARTEKRQAEAAQRAAELRAQEVTKELENTAKVFKLHMEELRAKQEEIAKKESDIKKITIISCHADDL
ncbi:Os12g0502100 [Oryza sativa Japonica Group]|uniref:Os12g0502100 protein n=1 Tax=Oryza sativa subsp. japonica TaxID=39947 RepID=Q0IN70_ORYSJ|nr:Os12g0502100 [Oryza sativa Japonica Group]|eukprot:NP_001066826.2 Os12g0502100 [Oryza sativa Japonica Group]